jgi:hypothetical protein
MMRKNLRRILPKRDNWHSLQEYAAGERSQEEFRLLRSHDAAVASTIASSKAAPRVIDWDAWEAKISHKEVLHCLRDFHEQQTKLLDTVLEADHLQSVKSQTEGWDLFDASVASCKKSVEQSEDILKNGARALWISFQNPPISLLSQSEWLDVDQYWQAFVEKHHFYHNHLNSAIEDPESKEYDAKQVADMKSKWQVFDGKGDTRQNNKHLYQRPSYEYYDLYRGPLVEHMIFYLVKTGGDYRFFPQNMPVQWFGEIYDIRFKLLSVLQRRLREVHESTLARDMSHEYMPANLDADGEANFMKLIAKFSASMELAAGRLMGNYILFSDSCIPVQTGKAFYAALQTDGGKGTFFSLGADVHCLFYKPAGEALPVPDPTECFHALADHAAMTGRRFEAGYGTAFEAFTEVLETRKAGLGGCWLTAPGENTADAFMRRLKRTDPAFVIYEAYVAEHKERWAGATALSMEQAVEAMPEIERKYTVECAEYDNVMFGVSDEFSAGAKLEQEKIAKLHESGELQALIDGQLLVGISDGRLVSCAKELSESIDAFESGRDKAVDNIMATKIAALARR